MLQTISNTPLITTIIPTYRRPKLLRRAIQSALNQTYPDIQICVYDNASGDETADVVREFAKKDGRVKYYCHPKNIGALKNFEYGMTQVTTPFFSFLSDDDLILPDFYQTALEGFERYPEAIFSSTQTVYMDAEGNYLGVASPNWEPGFYEPPSGLFGMLKHNHPTWTGILFRREVRKVVGSFDMDAGQFSDLDFELRVAARFPFVISQKLGAILYTHPTSFSANNANRVKNLWPYLAKIENNITNDKRIPLVTRQTAEILLKRDATKRLFRSGVALIINRHFDESREIACILREYYDSSLIYYILYATSHICQNIPPAHKILRFLKKLYKDLSLYRADSTHICNFDLLELRRLLNDLY